MRIKLTTISELKPGQMTCVELQQRRILLANVAGTVYAVDELCTHEDWSLCNGALKGESVECPLHGSRFDLKTGIPLDEPATQPLKTYPVVVIDNDTYVDI